MKPVQYCTGFIFYIFPASVHTHLNVLSPCGHLNHTPIFWGKYDQIMAFHRKNLTFSNSIQWITKINDLKLQITPQFFFSIENSAYITSPMHREILKMTKGYNSIQLKNQNQTREPWRKGGHWPFGFGMAAIVDMLPGPQNWTNSCSPTLRGLHMKFELIYPSDFRGCLKMLINADRPTQEPFVSKVHTGKFE